ncbi:MAG: hypothetical protein J6334_04800 [Kiritimatiellae bacterium]|nr:hypothetical protein [Kiritimatiellia bacterium]
MNDTDILVHRFCIAAILALAAGMAAWGEPRTDLYHSDLYAQVPLQDITDANRATYLADARAAGIGTIYLSFIDDGIGPGFFTEGPERQNAFARLKREIRHFEEAGFAVAVWVNGFGYGNVRPHFRASTRITSVDGRINGAVCPLDPELRRVLNANVRDIARAGAAFILMDDDYVQSARGFLGCACSNHLARVAARLGRERVTREELKAAYTGKPNALRTAFLDVSGEVAVELAKELRGTVDAVSPKIGMGICASYTHWDVEGCDLPELAKAFAGGNRPFLRISGAPYWKNAHWPGTGLEGIIEFVRMQSAWTRGWAASVQDENDPYPRKTALVPPWMCELYDKAVIADGHLARHKYMLCYGPDRAEPGYLEAHLADLPDDAKLRRIFAGTVPFGVCVNQPPHRLREATLPVPFANEGKLTELYAMPFASFLLARNGIPIRYGKDGPSVPFAELGIDPTAVNHTTYRTGTHREMILDAWRRKTGSVLPVYVETEARVYQIVHRDRARGEYAVLLENMGDSPAEVKIVTTGDTRILASLRGTFTALPGGLALAGLPPHAYAAVRFALAGAAADDPPTTPTTKNRNP